MLLLMVLVLSLVAACGSSQPAPAAGGGDATAGKKVFGEVAAPPCSGCHSVAAGKKLAGPSLAGIGAQGEEALHQSIVDPNAKITAGFSADIMPGNYGSQLSDQQLKDLIAYLITLK
jgi:mono/diheme cytochrome c family protein